MIGNEIKKKSFIIPISSTISTVFTFIVIFFFVSFPLSFSLLLFLSILFYFIPIFCDYNMISRRRMI